MPSVEPRHVALPSLYGAPAYVRPRGTPVAPVERPFDPDDLPLVAAMSEDERVALEQLPAQVWHPGGAVVGSVAEMPHAEAMPARGLSIRAIAGRFLGGD